MVVTNLTLMVTNFLQTPAHGSNKLFSNKDLRMVLINITLIVIKFLPRHAHGSDKPYTNG